MIVEKLVLVERVGAVAVLTLNRAQRHNSLVPQFLEEMLAALECIASDPGVRAAVLQANGRSFSTGGDMQGFHEHRDQLARYAGEIVGLLNEIILALVRLPQPVVAAVQGTVTGGRWAWCWAATWFSWRPRPASRPTTPSSALARMEAGQRCCRR
jgi:2-(1,2-epoxy-1,2-dihydrophenyl)acetyl-CoA isomerase